MFRQKIESTIQAFWWADVSLVRLHLLSSECRQNLKMPGQAWAAASVIIQPWSPPRTEIITSEIRFSSWFELCFPHSWLESVIVHAQRGLLCMAKPFFFQDGNCFFVDSLDCYFMVISSSRFLLHICHYFTVWNPWLLVLWPYFPSPHHTWSQQLAPLQFHIFTSFQLCTNRGCAIHVALASVLQEVVWQFLCYFIDF